MSLISKEHLSLTLQTIKTLLSRKADRSELQEEISKISDKIAQPDWNQNDETAADYVKNRTHYIGVATKSSTIEMTQIGQSGFTTTVSSDIYNPLKKYYDKAKYYVDNNEYSYLLTETTDYSTKYVFYTRTIGDNTDNLGWIELRDNNVIYLYFEGYPASASIVVDVEIEEVHKLDEKFIPDNIPKVSTAQVGQLLSVKAIDENGKPTEWETVNPEANTSGLELVDRTTGAHYNVYVDNGKLTMEVV